MSELTKRLGQELREGCRALLSEEMPAQMGELLQTVETTEQKRKRKAATPGNGNR
jgi:hypothetical protein